MSRNPNEIVPSWIRLLETKVPSKQNVKMCKSTKFFFFYSVAEAAEKRWEEERERGSFCQIHRGGIKTIQVSIFFEKYPRIFVPYLVMHTSQKIEILIVSKYVLFSALHILHGKVTQDCPLLWVRIAEYTLWQCLFFSLKICFSSSFSHTRMSNGAACYNNILVLFNT